MSERHVIPTGDSVVLMLLTPRVYIVDAVYNVNARFVNNINAALPQEGVTCPAKIRCSAPPHAPKNTGFFTFFANPFVFYNLALLIQTQKGDLQTIDNKRFILTKVIAKDYFVIRSDYFD